MHAFNSDPPRCEWAKATGQGGSSISTNGMRGRGTAIGSAVGADRPWLDRFMAALPEGGRVLDLGCGSGAPVAVALVKQGFEVTGVDTSPTLISLCRDRLSDQEWIVADMRTLMLGRRFDGILAWDSFFHLNADHQRSMFAVFAVHAAPQAVLLFSSGPAEGEALGSYRGDPLYHASLDAAEYRELLAQSGFDVMAHSVNDWETGGGRTIWMARFIS